MERTLESVSNVMFPGSRNIGIADRPFFSASKEISSSLPLQMLLHFNVYYSFAWLITEGSVLIWKSANGKSSIIAWILVILWLLVEPIRLLLGYSGNLREKISSLSGFILLTLLPVGVCIYMIMFQTKKVPVEIAISGIMLVFLVPELLLGYWTARTFVNLQTQRFYLQIVNAANEIEMEDVYSNSYGEHGHGDVEND